MRIIICGLLVLLAGCSSRLPTEEEQNFSRIANPNALSEVAYIEDATGLQWVSPALTVAHYDTLMIDPVGVHPQAKNVAQVPAGVLDRVSLRLTQILHDELGKGIDIVDSSQPKAARLQVEISRASTDMEDLKITEVLPYGALIGATKALLGTRDRNVRLLVESQLLDSQSGEVLAERVSVLLAEDILENDTELLKYQQIKEIVDQFTQDIVHFIRLTVYEAEKNTKPRHLG